MAMGWCTFGTRGVRAFAVCARACVQPFVHVAHVRVTCRNTESGMDNR